MSGHDDLADAMDLLARAKAVRAVSRERFTRPVGRDRGGRPWTLLDATLNQWCGAAGHAREAQLRLRDLQSLAQVQRWKHAQPHHVVGSQVQGGQRRYFDDRARLRRAVEAAEAISGEEIERLGQALASASGSESEA